MQIYQLHRCARRSARRLCKRHPRPWKMIVEIMWGISRAIRHMPRFQGKYDANKLYKYNGPHPVAKWMTESAGNLRYSVDHAVELLRQYEKRYNRKHASGEKLQYMQRLIYEQANETDEYVPKFHVGGDNPLLSKCNADSVYEKYAQYLCEKIKEM